MNWDREINSSSNLSKGDGIIMRKTSLSLVLLAVLSTIFIVGCVEKQPEASMTSAAPETIVITGPDNQSLRNEVMTLATKFAKNIDWKAIMAVRTEGRNSTAFNTVREQLRSFKDNNSRLAFVYILEQDNSTTRFLIPLYDWSEGPKFMQEYDTAPDELKAPLTEPVGVGPYTDQWGTFVSGFAPVNAISNKTIMVLSVDIRVA